LLNLYCEEFFLLQLSSAAQDTLKYIYVLRRQTGNVTNQALAKKLNVKPATITKMLKRLARLGFIIYEPYLSVELTESGRKVALEVIRHHRLIELYLARRLGFTWDEVHCEAEILEHVISEKLEQRIVEDLGDVRTCPHGHPVPTENGQIHEEDLDILSNYSVGDRLRIGEVMDDDSDALRYIGSLGILPGCSVKILEKTPFEGPIRIKVDSNVREITPNLASRIYAIRRSG
jgi:DtxR family Mn-dependent transcriptional regulator